MLSPLVTLSLQKHFPTFSMTRQVSNEEEGEEGRGPKHFEQALLSFIRELSDENEIEEYLHRLWPLRAGDVSFLLRVRWF